MTPTTILGPPTGSSRIEISRNEHGRIILHVTTDFGDARGVFTEEGAMEIVRELQLRLPPAE